jgi:hypothetical protein
MTTWPADPVDAITAEHLVALPRILTTWAELIEDQRKDRSSSVAIHARAAAARLVTLEQVALAASRYLESAPASSDHGATDHLKTALAAWECCVREQAPDFRAPNYRAAGVHAPAIGIVEPVAH